MTQDAPEQAAQLHAQGLAAWSQGQAVLAIELLVQAVQCDPGLALAHRNLGEMLRRMHQLDDALLAAGHAAALAPQDPQALYHLGLVHADRREYAQAVQIYRRALQLDGAHDQAWNNLGAALQELGASAEAQQAYRTALALNPANAAAHCNLGLSLQRSGDAAGARASLEAALRADPGLDAARLALAALAAPRDAA